MALSQLDVLAVRNIHNISIQPAPGLNLIVGPNASGKSSLLEAIFILGRARSFRTAQIRQAVAFEQPNLTVSARLGLSGSGSQLGVRIDGRQTEIRIDHEDRHKADLAYALPVQIIHPKSYRLLDGGSQLRREFLDWGIFNQHRDFLPHWRRFSKALQQRNALLKTRQSRQLPAWDRELAEYGSLITASREAYLAALQPLFADMAAAFLDTTDVVLKFQPGWDPERELSEILRADLEKDLRYGFTHSGPQRADFLCHQQNRPVRDYLSRGQQKLLVLALLLAQVGLLHQFSPSRCCILIDDLTAELDTANRLKLLEYLTRSGCQVFLTATSMNDFGNLDSIPDYKVFHVEQGRVTGC